MEKLARVGDILKDKYGKPGTVVGSTRDSLTVKYSDSVEGIIYEKEIQTLEQLGFKLAATHSQVLSNYK